MPYKRPYSVLPSPRWSSLKELSTQDRPRERLINEGAHHLEHAALISILLGTGRGSEGNALILAQRLLHSLGSVSRLGDATLDQLCLIKGIGPAKASRLIAAMELSKRIIRLQSDPHDESDPHNESDPHDERDPHDGSGYSQTYPTYLHLITKQCRETWSGVSPLLIACHFPPTITLNIAAGLYRTADLHTLDFKRMINLGVDSAITLSLSSTLDDRALHPRWLSKLVLEDQDAQWILISLRPQEELHPEEREAIPLLLDLGMSMNLDIKYVIAGSIDTEWLLLEPSEESSCV